MWGLIFDADGVVNRFIGQQVLWLADGPQSQWAIIIADVWKTAPFIGLLTLAGLQTIPAEVYEAAKVDGASAWQQFTRITLPMVSLHWWWRCSSARSTPCACSTCLRA